MRKRFAYLTAVAAFLVSLSATPGGPAIADDGTMHLMPSAQWAREVPDKQLAELRGGFTGIQWSMEFVAFVSNPQGDVTGGLPDGSNVDISDGSLQVQTSVAFGSGGSFNGIGIVNVIPGNFNVVDFQLNLNVNIINVANAASLSQVSSILGRQ